jgi:GNAT superfamily N-acetyltransferase
MRKLGAFIHPAFSRRACGRATAGIDASRRRSAKTRRHYIPLEIVPHLTKVAPVSCPRLIAAGHRERIAARMLAQRLFGKTHGDGQYDWMRASGVHTLVLLDPDVIGYVAYNHGMILGLGVDPDRRGEGLARRLIEAALDPPRPMGLHVAVANTAAQALYRAYGFEPRTEIEHYADGTPYVRMYRFPPAQPAHPEKEQPIS